MSVYVDFAKNAYRGMKMCHMIADTVDELNEMADKIGVARKWIQRSRSGIVHFDICQSMREKAVKLGAVEVDNRRLVELMKKQAQA